MREYHDLSNYYPTYVNFGKYTITKESNLPLVAQNLIDYYDGQSLVQQSNYYYRLTRDNKTVVMDTGDFEKLTNKYFVDNANGDVIVFGVGMGFIIFPLLQDPTVTSIKIVEYDQEIIDYVGGIIKQNDINNKVTIVQGDVKTYYQGVTNEQYDFVYIDYWDYLTPEAYDEMATYPTLYDGFKKDSNSIIFSWCQDIRHLIPGV